MRSCAGCRIPPISRGRGRAAHQCAESSSPPSWHPPCKSACISPVRLARHLSSAETSFACVLVRGLLVAAFAYCTMGFAVVAMDGLLLRRSGRLPRAPGLTLKNHPQPPRKRKGLAHTSRPRRSRMISCTTPTKLAPVAQWIERRPPEPGCANVALRTGAPRPNVTSADSGSRHVAKLAAVRQHGGGDGRADSGRPPICV